jgi:hypothetical protein
MVKSLMNLQPDDFPYDRTLAQNLLCNGRLDDGCDVSSESAVVTRIDGGGEYHCMSSSVLDRSKGRFSSRMSNIPSFWNGTVMGFSLVGFSHSPLPIPSCAIR